MVLAVQVAATALVAQVAAMVQVCCHQSAVAPAAREAAHVVVAPWMPLPQRELAAALLSLQLA